MRKTKRSEKKEIQSKGKHTMNKDLRSRKKEVCFEICAEPGCNVCLAGSFNNWKPLELNDKESKGKYARIVKLASGRHEYKFIVNDVWLSDAGNPKSTVNTFGSLNSIIEI